MKATPILMKPDLVKATIDGRKTQTRRVVKPERKGASRIMKQAVMLIGLCFCGTK